MIQCDVTKRGVAIIRPDGAIAFKNFRFQARVTEQRTYSEAEKARAAEIACLQSTIDRLQRALDTLQGVDHEKISTDRDALADAVARAELPATN